MSATLTIDSPGDTPLLAMVYQAMLSGSRPPLLRPPSVNGSRAMTVALADVTDNKAARVKTTDLQETVNSLLFIGGSYLEIRLMRVAGVSPSHRRSVVRKQLIRWTLSAI